MRETDWSEENAAERADEYKRSRLLIDGKPLIQDEIFETEPTKPTGEKCE